MFDLSVLITARNEEWLSKTVEDVLLHLRANTEIIVILDGEPTPVPVDKRVTVISLPQSIGQRAAINLAARMSTATYLMKLDAHCSIDEGFDEKLIAADKELNREDITQIPAMYNLHVFDWKCKICGFAIYQGPTPVTCSKCGNKDFERIVYWDREAHAVHGKGRQMRTEFWAFDSEMHFQYWHRYSRRPEAKGDLVDVMSSIGACFFMRRKRFWEIGGLDEGHGSWGQFGTEIACKSWLSGGRHIVNKRTWFAHLFRTQGGDFGFPYKNSGRNRLFAQVYSRELWRENKWPGQIKPLSWLIEKFAPITGLKAGLGWHEPTVSKTLEEINRFGKEFNKDLTVGVVYYSDFHADPHILEIARRQLKQSLNGHKLVSVTLAPLELGQNIVLSLERSRLTMFKQILTGLEALNTDIAFLCEHDVLYDPSHFKFIPPNREQFFYNENVWRVDAKTGHALFYRCRQVSGLCAYRDILIDHYKKRVAAVEAAGHDHQMGYEPGTRRSIKLDGRTSAAWWSERPNIDIRHGQNLTKSRWSQDQFRDKSTCQEWQDSDSVPGWGRTEGRFSEFLTMMGDK